MGKRAVTLSSCIEITAIAYQQPVSDVTCVVTAHDSPLGDPTLVTSTGLPYFYHILIKFSRHHSVFGDIFLLADQYMIQ